MNKRQLLGEPIAASQITARSLFERRRQLLGAAATTLVAAPFAALAPWLGGAARAQTPANANPRLAARANAQYRVADPPTAYRDVTGYNNYYEFGTDKADPARYAGALVTRPWTIAVDGLVAKPRVFDIDELLKLAPQEERIYRLRCVEGWSMVIPWIGYPLAELLRRVEPLGSARYVEFTSRAERRQMPGLASPVLDWPYVEALRLDEAWHPLTLLAFGLYGELLPRQNGAPLRLAVPWKYGFKSAKAIVRIRCTERMPRTSWSAAAPAEYGFYANVNPQVDHPRWSQASERRIGEAQGLLAAKRPTLPFNGYAAQVAELYRGLDLRANF